MKSTLAQRAAPLLITTMLVVAPAWAQPNGPSSQDNAAPTATTANKMSNAPSGTAQKAAPLTKRT